MKTKFSKFFYLNVIIFVFVIILVFIIGLFVIHNINGLKAAEEDTLPPTISNVKIDNITSTSSVITWETNEVADSLVNFGLDKNYGIGLLPRMSMAIRESQVILILKP